MLLLLPLRWGLRACRSAAIRRRLCFHSRALSITCCLCCAAVATACWACCVCCAAAAACFGCPQALCNLLEQRPVREGWLLQDWRCLGLLALLLSVLLLLLMRLLLLLVVLFHLHLLLRLLRLLPSLLHLLWRLRRQQRFLQCRHGCRPLPGCAAGAALQHRLPAIRQQRCSC